MRDRFGLGFSFDLGMRGSRRACFGMHAAGRLALCVALSACLTFAFVPALAFAEVAGDDAAEGGSVVFEVEQQVSLPDAYDLPSNDELFEAYAWSTLYGNNGIALLGNFGSASGVLNDTELAIYNKLKAAVADIAAGRVSSTKVDVSAELNIESWLADDPGDEISDELMADATKRFAAAADVSKVLECLLVDCPYELYWFNKTSTEAVSGGVKFGFSIKTSDSDEQGKVWVSITNAYWGFSVASAYAGDEVFTTDIDKTSAASSAVEAAWAVVDANAGKSDYEKLVAYKDYICEQVSYNYDAVSGSYADGYGDPWQLIYVFDGDADTNVVCEGYSKAFQYLCDLSSFEGDVTCYTLTGSMIIRVTIGEETKSVVTPAHMWNMVNISGKNYLVDVTNVDESVPDGLFLAGGTTVELEGLDYGAWSLGIPLFYLDENTSITGVTIIYLCDADLASLYGPSILTLSTEAYDPADDQDPVDSDDPADSDDSADPDDPADPADPDDSDNGADAGADSGSDTGSDDSGDGSNSVVKLAAGQAVGSELAKTGDASGWQACLALAFASSVVLAGLLTLGVRARKE